MTLARKSVGPYMGVTRDATRTDGPYRIIVYGAYNVMGLIGSENNGIAILDNLNRCVVCDLIAPQDSGFYGPSKSQLEYFEQLLGMDHETFRFFVNSHPNSRGKI